MRAPADTAEIRAAFADARRPGAAYTTSLFADDAACAAWIRAGAVRLLRGDGFALLLRRDRGLERVYHAAADADALAVGLARLGDPAEGVTALVADLVGRPAAAAALRDAYARAGFAPHRRLLRLQRLAGPPPESRTGRGPEVRPARPDEARRVHAFLERHLDPLGDQIPEPSDVEEAVARGNVLIEAAGGALGGALLFAVQGRAATLRYWYVDAARHDRGIGGALIREFIGRCRDCARIVLWVIDDNADAIVKYEHYGFRHEGLEDHIVVKRGKALP
jgi:ribosomal protein S18 acetylase RimI-like enzyme